MNFDRLINFRDESELSQRDLADILDVSKSQYARWETMEQIIPLNHLNNACNYFCSTMEYITGLSSKNNFVSKVEKLSASVIGKRLRQFRKANKLSQKQLAQFLNTSQSTISSYERGKTMLLTVFAIQICTNYKNVSMDWLCGRTD